LRFSKYLLLDLPFVKYFAPAFNQKLVMISGSAQIDVVPSKEKTLVRKLGNARIEKIASLTTRSNTEHMGFIFTWLISARSRTFKLKTYPSIGYFVVYLGIIVFANKKFTLANLHTNPKLSKLVVLSCFYMVSYILFQVISNIKFSDMQKASWFYGTAPIQHPGKIINGAMKAIIMKFFIPFALVISIILTLVVGIQLIPNLLLGLVNQVIICYLIAYLNFNSFPFSKSETTKIKGGSFIRGLIAMIFPIGIGVMHYFIFDYTAVVFIVLALSFIALWLIMDGVANKSMNQLTYNYSELT
jgi:hypothetical protein